eukprot:TRINITY_DN7045_c0_g1_i1.p1 TRINITY_DN7045_c0_g1~~TRINITY_DN7045_c0_g1_i1.p1  ORF type:complete len:561 (-),score=103.45 TRINITY_DN7045_c0_g1_i1:896-2578(-)
MKKQQQGVFGTSPDSARAVSAASSLKKPHSYSSDADIYDTQALSSFTRYPPIDDGSVHVGDETSSGLDTLEVVQGDDNGVTKKLGVWGLCIMTFFCVSGGPYGIEALVATAPPLYVFLGLLVFPIAVNIPLALVCAELNSIVDDPNGGGLVSWILFTFGRFWGFIAGFNSTIVAILDNSLYPILCVGYLNAVLSSYAPTLYEFDIDWYGMSFQLVVGVLIVLLVTLINLLGLEVVGVASWILTVMIIAPFVALFGITIVKDRSAYHPQIFINAQDTADASWYDFFSNLIWNNVGWLNAGFLANEVTNPNRNFSLGMVLSAIGIAIFYVLPTYLALCLEPDWQNWYVGYFSKIGGDFGGQYLSIAFALAGMMSNLGIYIAGLSTTARGIAYMANPEIKMLPRFLSLSSKSVFSSSDSKESETNPWMSILVCSVIVVIMLPVPFQSIQDMEILLNSIVTTLVYIAFIYLRFKKPNLPRAYRVPLNNFWSVLLCLPGIAPMGFLFYFADSITLIACASAIAASLVAYCISSWSELKVDIHKLVERLKKNREAEVFLGDTSSPY